MPLITTSSESIQTPENGDTKSIEVKISGIDTLRDIALSMRDGGRIGVICNTVNNAKMIYQMLESVRESHWNIELYHARFAIGHRMMKGERILGMVGKNSVSTVESLDIVVGTQVLEQSLDIDFDVLFTENTPIDLIFQRTGRLHRHDSRTLGGNRPTGFETPVMHILEGLNSVGSQMVYGSYPLLATENLLHTHDVLRVPDDISPMLEFVYGKNVQFANEQRQYRGGLRMQKDKTQDAVLKSPSNVKNLYGWVGDKAPGETTVQAKVRDGVSGPDVILLYETDDGYAYIGEGGVQKSLPTHRPYHSEAIDIKNSTVTLPFFMFGHDDKKWDEIIAEMESRAVSLGFNDLWHKSALHGEIPVILRGNVAEFENCMIYYDKMTGLEATSSE